MTDEELNELQTLRKWKQEHELKPLQAAFEQLQRVLDRPKAYAFDSIMPVAAYRILADALIELKNEVLKQ